MDLLISPEELLLGCKFADVEHTAVANALNATAKLVREGEKEFALKKFLPDSLDYLNKHLTHEERVLEHAIVYWAEEKGLEEFLDEFLRARLNLADYKGFLNWLEKFKETKNPPPEMVETLKLLAQQKYSHTQIISLLKEELGKIDPKSEPKRILEQLGIKLSFVLNRVLKSDRKYVEFYERNNIPACEERPLLPPEEFLKTLKDILGENYFEPASAG
jgi:hemerythrin